MNNFELSPIIDAHSHVQFPVYDADRADVLQRAKDLNVKMVAVGTQASNSEAGIILANKHPEIIWATVGFHPSHLSGKWHHDKNEQSQALPEKFDIEKLRKLAADPKVVAIGECGLDYYRITDNESGIKEKQKEVFLRQAELAKEFNKPLMIHCRPSKGTDDAYEDLFDLSQGSNVIGQMSIIHFYVGSPAMTKKFVSEGYYFTLGGVVTFARDYDESIKYIPSDRILLETDCPYVAPKSRRGKRNEPAFIGETGKAIAEIKNMELNLLLEQVYKNTKAVFKI